MPETALLYHPDLKNYSFGPAHPLGAERFELFFDFFNFRFSSFKEEFQIIKPPPAEDAALESVHTCDYIRVIKSASHGRVFPDIHRYVSGDNLNPLTGYVPGGIEEASRIIVGISLLAAELVAEGKFKQAISIGGGMHHAKPDYAEGFCFYNDVAIAVKYLQEKYNLKRILVLDTDAHAGNGTKEIFYADPAVLFIDIHQDPRTIYPGCGFIKEIGNGGGEGFTVNLPVLPRTGNAAYEYIFDAVIFPLAAEFRPEIIIRYGGSDPHYLDPLTDLGLTLAGFKMLGRQVNALAGEFTQGRSIDLLLSGYNLKVLPFAWSCLLSGLLGWEVDLNGLKEESPPSTDARLGETKDLVRQLKNILKPYWRCF